MPTFESINQLTLPPQVESRMRALMRRRSEGKLSANEAQELDLLIQVQESLAVVRAKARTLSGSAPQVPTHPVQTVRNGLPVMQVPAGTPAIDPAAVRHFLEEEAF